MSPSSPAPETPSRRRRRVVLLALGTLLVLLGAVLWIMTGTTAYGLVSGLGVVFGYVGAEPWLERWRNS